MSVVRYEPWGLHRDLWQEVNKLFDRVASNDTSGATADWVPPVDIEEYADRFALHIDVPGVDPETIEVTLEKGVLTIAGTRAEAEKPEGVERRRVERASGRFHRRFTLPDTADAEGVTANGRNGVLEIGIPKRAASQPRRIAVSA